MIEQERQVVTKENSQVDQQGAVVNTRSESVRSAPNSKRTAINAVWYLYGLIAILLAMRFALKLFSANPSNGFVSFIYNISGVLSAPFDSIFGVTKTVAGTASSVFEPSILVAIAVYALVAWGITKLLTLNENNSDTA